MVLRAVDFTSVRFQQSFKKKLSRLFIHHSATLMPKMKTNSESVTKCD